MGELTTVFPKLAGQSDIAVASLSLKREHEHSRFPNLSNHFPLQSDHIMLLRQLLPRVLELQSNPQGPLGCSCWSGELS